MKIRYEIFTYRKNAQFFRINKLEILYFRHIKSGYECQLNYFHNFDGH